MEYNDENGYKVSFTIRGNNLADGVSLSKENLKESIMQEYDISGIDYYGNRSIDTVVSDLEIGVIKEEKVFYEKARKITRLRGGGGVSLVQLNGCGHYMVVSC